MLCGANIDCGLKLPLAADGESVLELRDRRWRRQRRGQSALALAAYLGDFVGGLAVDGSYSAC